MNHLRPPSGFVFVLCFVSEGGGGERKARRRCRASALNTNSAAGFTNTGVIHSAPEVTAGSGPPGASAALRSGIGSQLGARSGGWLAGVPTSQRRACNIKAAAERGQGGALGVYTCVLFQEKSP